MNFKRFGRTANLFDEANLEGGVYLASNGNKYGSITDGVRSGVKINALPNTPYTLSLYSNTNISIQRPSDYLDNTVQGYLNDYQYGVDTNNYQLQILNY